MSRVAGLLIASAVLASAASGAGAADYRGGKYGHGPASAGPVEVVGDGCRAPVVETVRYKEQVCRHGVAGYAYCRWVDRQHDVRVPETCGPRVTTEGTTPAKRGAFPPYPRG